MTFFAHMIQKPEEKPQISPIFYSNQNGTGKSSFLKFFSQVMGAKYASTGQASVYFSKHSTEHHFKLLNVIEEVNKSVSQENFEKLKDYIQRDISNTEEKFKNVVKAIDYCRYIQTTNLIDALPLTKDQRRFLVYNFKKSNDDTIRRQSGKLLNDVYNGPHRFEIMKLFGEYLTNFKFSFDTSNNDEWSLNRRGSAVIERFIKYDQIEEVIAGIYENTYNINKSKYGIKLIKKDILKVKLKDLFNAYRNYIEDIKRLSTHGFAKRLSVLETHGFYKEHNGASRTKWAIFDLKKIHEYLNKQNENISNDNPQMNSEYINNYL